MRRFAYLLAALWWAFASTAAAQNLSPGSRARAGDLAIVQGVPVAPCLVKFNGRHFVACTDLSGDVTTSGSGVTTIATNAVTLSKFAQGAANTVVANGTSGTANFTAFAMPSCSAITGALGWLSGTGFQCNAITPSACANPCTIGNITIEQGAGYPTSTTRNLGSIFWDSLSGYTFQKLTASSSGATYVQGAATAANTYAMTLSATPTPGDTLVAGCFRNAALPAANTSWTAPSPTTGSATHNQVSADPYIAIFYHSVVSGDGTSWTPCTGTSTKWGGVIWEVSNFDPTVSASWQNIQYGQTTAASGTPSATGSATTSTTNTLALGFFAWTNIGSTGHFPTGTLGGSTWNSQVSASSGSLGGTGTNSPAAVYLGSNTYASSSTAVSATGSLSSSGGPDNYGLTATVLILQPPPSTSQVWHRMDSTAHVQNSISAAYTTVLADAGKQLYHPSADTTARTWTIDSNANVAWEVGTWFEIINDCSAGTLTLAITTDTLVLFTSGATGSRTIAACGQAHVEKVTATRWVIWGNGVT